MLWKLLGCAGLAVGSGDDGAAVVAPPGVGALGAPRYGVIAWDVNIRGANQVSQFSVGHRSGWMEPVVVRRVRRAREGWWVEAPERDEHCHRPLPFAGEFWVPDEAFLPVLTQDYVDTEEVRSVEMAPGLAMLRGEGESWGAVAPGLAILGKGQQPEGVLGYELPPLQDDLAPNASFVSDAWSSELLVFAGTPAWLNREGWAKHSPCLTYQVSEPDAHLWRWPSAEVEARTAERPYRPLRHPFQVGIRKGNRSALEAMGNPLVQDGSCDVLLWVDEVGEVEVEVPQCADPSLVTMARRDLGTLELYPYAPQGDAIPFVVPVSLSYKSVYSPEGARPKAYGPAELLDLIQTGRSGRYALEALPVLEIAD